MATSKNLKLKLLVDRENKKVLFAESDKDFVDILFSFLTMPLGSVVRILNKQSSLGYFDNLYQSIENLDESYFSTEACKEMLLNPLNSSGELCEDLILRIDESNPRNFYSCKKHGCRMKTFPYFSLVPKSKCGCGEFMDFVWNWKKEEHRGPNGDGVFVRKNVTFIITDDLCVIPASTTSVHSVIQNLGIEDLDNTEEICFDLDVKLLQDLLKRSLTSKSPITDVYFQKTDVIEKTLGYSKFPKVEDIDADRDAKKVKAKLIICKSTDTVLYIEAKEGFVDLLFSFLSFPLGSIVRLLRKVSSVGCVDNLYKSVEDMRFDTEYLRPDTLQLLVDPKLTAHFSHDNSLLSLSEKGILSLNFPNCHACFMAKTRRVATVCIHGASVGTECIHGVKDVRRTEMNPKLSSGEVGGSYAQMEAKFLITDNLQVKPFSPLSSIQILKKYKLTCSDIAEKEINIDETDALNLLRACLNSENPFDVFVPNMKSKKEKIGRTIHVRKKEKNAK